MTEEIEEETEPIATFEKPEKDENDVDWFGANEIGW